MANDCYYLMHVTAKSKEAIDRFLAIMQDKDETYKLYRIFNSSLNTLEERYGLFHADLDGDVAWSADQWFHPSDPNLTSIPQLCKLLNISVEIFTEECGLEFQEHYIVNSKGEVLEEYENDDFAMDENGVRHGSMENWGLFLGEGELLVK